jgi:hypothetical protein
MYFTQLQLANGDNYIPVEEAVQVEKLSVIANADAGATASVTLTDGTNTVNVATCDGDTAGTITEGVADATNGKITIPAGGLIKITCASTNGVGFGCTLALDEYLIGNR